MSFQFTLSSLVEMQPYKYNAEEHSELRYKAMAVRGHELDIREQLAKEKPNWSVKKRHEYARMMANYAGVSRYGTFKPLDPYVPPEECDQKARGKESNKEKDKVKATQTSNK